MAKQPYLVNTSQKQMEVFSSYGGGMVTQAHPEKLKDDQSILIENADIIQGGTLQARGAYSQTNSCEVVYLNTFDNVTDEDITFDELKLHTFDSLKDVGIAQKNIDSSLYYTTLGQWETEGIKFDVLKTYKMDSLKTQGVLKPNTGNSQGMFRYHKADGFIDIIAIKGELYTIIDDKTYRKLSIKGLNGFQTTRNVEAIQHRDKMYIATGNGLVVFDGVQASLLTAYTPNGLEALYIGTNGYAADPSNYLTDTTGAANTILGLTVSSRYGVTNIPVKFITYVQKIEADVLEYKFEVKQGDTTVYTLVQDWGLSKELNYTFSSQAEYMVKVSLRKQGTTVTLSEYILPRYTVNTTYSSKEDDTGVNFDNLASCNRIFIHYDRLFLYGDIENKDYLYVSHLNQFDYFPRTNILKITDPLRGALQSVVRYKNMLLCWTNGSIQKITGVSPTDYVIEPIHTTLGTLYPKSVQIIKNYVAFIGNDNGVYILKSFSYSSDDKLNVDRLDSDIRDSIGELIGKSTNVLSTITNNQYFLYIETDAKNYVYRFYYDYGIWVRDTIELSFHTLDTLSNVVTACSTNNGTVYKLNPNLFIDGTNKRYTMRVISKNYTFGIPHHRKKLKQYQLITKLRPSSSITVRISADDKLLSVTPTGYDPNQNSDSQKLIIMSSGRFRYVTVDITIPVRDALQLIGFGFVFKQNTPK